MPGSTRGDGDASDDLAVPDAVQPAALLRSCEAHFLSQEELNDGFEVFCRKSPLPPFKVNGDGFRRWKRMGACSEKLRWAHYGIGAVNALDAQCRQSCQQLCIIGQFFSLGQ